MPLVSVAVDVGGTFTDLVVYRAAEGSVATAKVLTTPQDLAAGIFQALDRAGVDPREVDYLKHGTTTAINTVIERTGAKTALITTRGFRDVLELGRGNRPDMFDLFYRPLPPLVPRDLRFEISERLDGGGEEVRPVATAELEALLPAIEAAGVEAIAVCLLHAYRNPAHEAAVGEWLRRHSRCFVSLSYELSREWREYERTSTAVVNAYVGPRTGSYVGKLADSLEGRGFEGSFFLMKSDGGVTSAALAAARPVYLLESGPVAGVVAAALLSRRLGHAKAISFDMGGTTAKCALIDDGEVATAPIYYVGGYRQGYPVQVPVVDIYEVGAGGGSIAWIDDTGALKVGPRSAGAAPGPACYGRGGSEPTVTDANLVLGRLDDRGLLDGELALDGTAAARAVAERVAETLGRDPFEIADGIVRLAVVTMSSAVRRVSVERGYDPRDFILIASGGAGPIHAAAVARELSIPTVVVPPLPGHFSAWGMLLADIRQEHARTRLQRLGEADPVEMEAVLAELEAETRADLAGEAPRLHSVRVQRLADIRYVGQEHGIRTPLPERLDEPGALAGVRAVFDRLYEQRYGHSDPDAEAEVTALRLVADGALETPVLPEAGAAAGPAQPAAFRETYFEEGGWLRCPIYVRDALGGGHRISGPAIVAERASTTVLHPGDVAEVDRLGNLIVGVRPRSEPALPEDVAGPTGVRA